MKYINEWKNEFKKLGLKLKKIKILNSIKFGQVICWLLPELVLWIPEPTIIRPTIIHRWSDNDGPEPEVLAIFGTSPCFCR